MAESPAAGDGKWLPVEGNPEVFDKYAAKLGLPAEPAWSHYDVLSLEDWGLDAVPKPCQALMMLFPMKESWKQHRAEEEAALRASGVQAGSNGLWFMKQLEATPNACGTIGLLHVLINSSTAYGGPLAFLPDSWLAKFMAKTADMTPAERNAALEGDSEAEAEHSSVVQQGQSHVVDDTHQHFIVFLNRGGTLYELDGFKFAPIPHGPTTQETLLADAARVVKEFMDRDEGELRFTFIALCNAPPQED